MDHLNAGELGAHPRSRGENSTGGAVTVTASGSSPLTRGKPARAIASTTTVRLIPAHAGNSSAVVASTASTAAHPRSRGENAHRLGGTEYPEGSSPLTRGKRGRPIQKTMSTRLIPAHAGKTRQALYRFDPSAAHPRSRGENTWLLPRGQRARGSSPLTRGKLIADTHGLTEVRLIPAHAGKTLRAAREPRRHWAHPRSRGENPSRTSHSAPSGGSSPLTRGKLGLCPDGEGRLGLIPAHAGKTPPPMLRSCRPGAHPRSRGENTSVSPKSETALGSSPLTRGKLVTAVVEVIVQRLIPAHAGKTSRQVVENDDVGAHPRSRGENRFTIASHFWHSGSSPLTRGKRSCAHIPRERQRLIPAHAGKTRALTALRRTPTAHPRSRGENWSLHTWEQ